MRRSVALLTLALALCGLSTYPASAQGTADLAITKSADRTHVRVGQQITYTITVTNQGPDVATDVVWGDAVPDELNLVSFTCSPGNPSGARPFCVVATLANGASATETLVAELTPLGRGEDRRVGNTSFIVSSSQTDPNSSNDQDSLSVKIIGGPR